MSADPITIKDPLILWIFVKLFDPVVANIPVSTLVRFILD
jgi:hypothetical protein